MKLSSARRAPLIPALCALLLAVGGSCAAVSAAAPAAVAAPAASAHNGVGDPAVGLAQPVPLAKKTDNQPGLGGGPGEAPSEEETTAPSDDAAGGRTRLIVIVALFLGAVGIGLTVWAFLTWRRGETGSRAQRGRTSGDSAQGRGSGEAGVDASAADPAAQGRPDPGQGGGEPGRERRQRPTRKH